MTRVLSDFQLTAEGKGDWAVPFPRRLPSEKSGRSEPQSTDRGGQGERGTAIVPQTLRDGSGRLCKRSVKDGPRRPRPIEIEYVVEGAVVGSKQWAMTVVSFQTFHLQCNITFHSRSREYEGRWNAYDKQAVWHDVGVRHHLCEPNGVREVVQDPSTGEHVGCGQTVAKGLHCRGTDVLPLPQTLCNAPRKLALEGTRARLPDNVGDGNVHGASTESKLFGQRGLSGQRWT
mmetsp:Transcript_54381/g.145126  ORF Transcript_54381/g.145126 Transcript_54381/m.145126 type:complete len:231 (+) Transcript_54381:818-1510(+)